MSKIFLGLEFFRSLVRPIGFGFEERRPGEMVRTWGSCGKHNHRTALKIPRPVQAGSKRDTLSSSVFGLLASTESPQVKEWSDNTGKEKHMELLGGNARIHI